MNDRGAEQVHKLNLVVADRSGGARLPTCPEEVKRLARARGRLRDFGVYEDDKRAAA